MATGDVQQGGDGADDGVVGVGGGEQGGGAVLAAQAQLEGLDPGRRRGAVALGLAFLGDQPLDLGLGVGEAGGGALVGVVEALLALLLHGHTALEAGELLLGLGGPGAGGGDELLEAADLGLPGLDPAAAGSDLTGELGQPLAAVGRGTGEPGQPALLRGVRGLGLLAGGDGGGELLRGGRHLGEQGGLGLAGLRGLGPQLLGVAAGGGLVLLVLGEQAHPLGRDRAGGLHPVAQALQAHEPLVRPGQLGGGLGGTALDVGEPLADVGEGVLDGGAALDEGGLVGDLLLEHPGELHEVVGEQSQPCVAGVGLDDGRAPGGLGLPAERAELAADLTGEVLHPGEVGLHRLELAQRPLLAAAVLEHAGGLLDEAATLLGGGAQHGVELALADDHVHLAAETGVGEQLLHVEQPAGRAVDGVLGAPAAEHRAGDRDLGVVDRQGAVGVVDGQADLGPAQRRAPGGAGEDDVLHLAAAQALGPLLAHDPGEGVDDVGLAGAVRADDAGDARLEAHRRRRGEGLEALQGQRLEVHGEVSALVGRPGWLGVPPRVGCGPTLPAAGGVAGTSAGFGGACDPWGGRVGGAGGVIRWCCRRRRSARGGGSPRR